MLSRVDQRVWCARRQSAFISVLFFFASLCSLLLFGAKEAQAQTEPLDSSAPPVGEVAEPDAKPVEEAVAPVSDPAGQTLEGGSTQPGPTVEDPVAEESKPLLEEASAPVAATPVLEETSGPAAELAAEPVPNPEAASSPITGRVSEVSEPHAALEVAGSGVELVAQPVDEVVAPAIEEKSPLADTALDPPALDPIVGFAGETVAPVAEGLPKVDSAAVQPVVDALPAVEATPVVQPVVDTLPKVDPAMPVSDPVVDVLPKVEASPALPVADPLSQQVDTAGLQPVGDPALRTSLAQPTTTPVIETLQPETNLASPSTMLPGASRALESASLLLGAAVSTTIASQSNLVGLSSSSYESVVRVLNSYSSAQEEVSHSVLGRLLTDLNAAFSSSFSSWAQSVPTNQTPQPFSPGVLPAGSSSTPGFGSSGGMGLLGFLALFSLLLLGGKFLRSMRELLKPSSALIPIIERPG